RLRLRDLRGLEGNPRQHCVGEAQGAERRRRDRVKGALGQVAARTMLAAPAYDARAAASPRPVGGEVDFRAFSAFTRAFDANQSIALCPPHPTPLHAEVG